jgi:hypothetical protein
MQAKDIPQDKSKLLNVTKEICYAIDENGQYTTALSSGWEIKTEALNVAWADINHRMAVAKQEVLAGKCSPIVYFMEWKLMDLAILASYTGLWQWQIKRHMKAKVFNKLPEKTIQKYATVFEVTTAQLKNMTVNEG